jgi:hypothetical protein
LNVAEFDFDELKAQGVNFQKDKQFISANLSFYQDKYPLLKLYRQGSSSYTEGIQARF